MARNSSFKIEHPLEKRQAESSRIREKYANDDDDDDDVMGGETAIRNVIGNLAGSVRKNVLDLVNHFSDDPDFIDFIHEEIRILDTRIQNLTNARNALIIQMTSASPSQQGGELETSGNEPSA